jgi:hypothetical protein
MISSEKPNLTSWTTALLSSGRVCCCPNAEGIAAKSSPQLASTIPICKCFFMTESPFSVFQLLTILSDTAFLQRGNHELQLLVFLL